MARVAGGSAAAPVAAGRRHVKGKKEREKRKMRERNERRKEGIVTKRNREKEDGLGAKL